MKILTLVSMSILASSLLLASADLADKATKAGLKAIPTDKAALSKLIDPNKTITALKKWSLVKNYYFEPRLSKSGIISCNTCHNLGMGGVDGVPAAVGHNWTANPHHLNSPTVYNAVFFAAQFWDGRSPDLRRPGTGTNAGTT